jgi:hypothetical protein
MVEPVTTGAVVAAGWTAQKLLGKTFDIVGDDLAKLYEKVRNKIFDNAAKKISDINSDEQTNLRVTRDVLWNGSFADDPICTEYFGGILASSRSEEGKDDMGVFYLDVIKSLPSDHLRMHYIIYRSLNKLLIANDQKKSLNPGQENELNNEKLFFAFSQNFENQFGNVDFVAILHGLIAKNIIGGFKVQNYESEDKKLTFYYCEIAPKPLGVQLFAIANNQFQNWRQFSLHDFEDFEGISLPEITSQTKEDLVKKSSVLMA